MIQLPILARHTFSSHANAVQRDHADTNGCALLRMATDSLQPGAAQNKPVRKRRSGRDRTTIAQAADTIPAHHPKSLPADLNSRWRVADDPRQWILQNRKGRRRAKSSGWLSRSFCATRSALLRCIREYCGKVDAESLNLIENLPETHLEWRRSKDK